MIPVRSAAYTFHRSVFVLIVGERDTGKENVVGEGVTSAKLDITPVFVKNRRENTTQCQC